MLLAAATVALALVPMLLASLQLGYQADVAASEPEGPGIADADRTLTEAAAEVAAAGDGEDWDERENAIDAFRESFDNRTATLVSDPIDQGTIRHRSYNESVADAWIDDDCPAGDGREFGPCENSGGIVVQERAGETHFVAVGIDVSVIDNDRTERGTLLVRIRSG